MTPTEKNEAEEVKGWKTFISFCKTLGFGKIEGITIKDGVPVHAEVVTRSVKLS